MRVIRRGRNYFVVVSWVVEGFTSHKYTAGPFDDPTDAQLALQRMERY